MLGFCGKLRLLNKVNKELSFKTWVRSQCDVSSGGLGNLRRRSERNVKNCMSRSKLGAEHVSQVEAAWNIMTVEIIVKMRCPLALVRKRSVHLRGEAGIEAVPDPARVGDSDANGG